MTMVDLATMHLCGLLENHSGIVQVSMVFIEFGESAPETVQFAHGLLTGYGFDGFCVRQDLFRRLSFEELHTFVPLMDIVRILSQHHTTQ